MLLQLGFGIRDGKVKILLYSQNLGFSSSFWAQFIKSFWVNWEFLLRIFFLTALPLLGIGCQENSKKENELWADQFKSDLENIARAQESEYNILLSAKYNLDTIQVASLIDEYLKHHDIATYIASKVLQGKEPDKLPEGKQSQQQTIDHLSIKYSIPKSTIASIIIDYKRLRADVEKRYSR